MPSDGHGAGSGDMNSSLLPPMVVVVQGEKVLWGEDAFDVVWLSTLVIVLSSNPWNIRSSSEAKGGDELGWNRAGDIFNTEVMWCH